MSAPHGPEVAALHGRRVLVTGAGGYIGRPLCRALAQAGADVHGTTRRVPPLGTGSEGDLTWHEADVTVPESVDRVVGSTRPQLIYHLAGQVTGVRDVDRTLEIFASTLASTVNLLVAAQRHGAERVVLAGSMEEPEPDEPLPTPSSPYAAAKWASGGYGRMFDALYDLDVVELRLFMTYGPGHQPVGKLVPAVVLGVLRGAPPQLGSGQRRIDWVYLDDVVVALVRAATADVPARTRPDVGSGNLHSIREFAQRLAWQVDPDVELEFGAQQDRPAEREAVADLSLTRAVLGWAPATDLDTGLARVVAWYRQRYDEGCFDTP